MQDRSVYLCRNIFRIFLFYIYFYTYRNKTYVLYSCNFNHEIVRKVNIEFEYYD